MSAIVVTAKTGARMGASIAVALGLEGDAAFSSVILCARNVVALADALKIRADEKAKLSQTDIRLASLEQPSTEFLLQSLDPARKRRLRYAAALCCPGKALLFAEGDKIEDLVHLHRHNFLSTRQLNRL
jgi:hypothetical protein